MHCEVFFWPDTDETWQVYLIILLKVAKYTRVHLLDVLLFHQFVQALPHRSYGVLPDRVAHFLRSG